MGYYTNYDLIYDNSNLLSERFFKGDKNCNGKWYSFEKDIADFARKTPECEAIIYGKGEESDDLWRCYIKNGKHQTIKAKITYDEPNWGETDDKT